MVLPLWVSYRDLEQTMGERGVPGDHSTIYRWVQRYAPRLAAFKRPARILFVETIPRTASGKVQKHVLRQFHPEETLQRPAL